MNRGFLIQKVVEFLSDQGPFVCVNRAWLTEWRRQHWGVRHVFWSRSQISDRVFGPRFYKHQIVHAPLEVLIEIFEMVKPDFDSFCKTIFQLKRHDMIDWIMRSRRTPGFPISIYAEYGDADLCLKYEYPITGRYGDQYGRALQARNADTARFYFLQLEKSPEFDGDFFIDYFVRFYAQHLKYPQQYDWLINYAKKHVSILSDLTKGMIYLAAANHSVDAVQSLPFVYTGKWFERVGRVDVLDYLVSCGKPLLITSESQIYPLPSVFLWFMKRGQSVSLSRIQSSMNNLYDPNEWLALEEIFDITGPIAEVLHYVNETTPVSILERIVNFRYFAPICITTTEQMEWFHRFRLNSSRPCYYVIGDKVTIEALERAEEFGLLYPELVDMAFFLQDTKMIHWLNKRFPIETYISKQMARLLISNTDFFGRQVGANSIQFYKNKARETLSG